MCSLLRVGPHVRSTGDEWHTPRSTGGRRSPLLDTPASAGGRTPGGAPSPGRLAVGGWEAVLPRLQVGQGEHSGRTCRTLLLPAVASADCTLAKIVTDHVEMPTALSAMEASVEGNVHGLLT